jgi:hypothetical protein
MSKQTVYSHKAVYIGRRLSGTKVLQAFLLLPDKKEIFFAGVRGVYMGYTYLCTDKNIAKRPERAEDEQLNDPQWEAEDALVDAYNEEKRGAQKMSKLSKPAVNHALEALMPLLKGLHYFDYHKLIEHITKLAIDKTIKKKSKRNTQ